MPGGLRSTALALSFEAPTWNPANLGLPDRPRWSIGLAGVTGTLTNNSLTYGQITDLYGKFLDDAAKSELLAEVRSANPDGLLTLDFELGGSFLGFSLGRFASRVVDERRILIVRPTVQHLPRGCLADRPVHRGKLQVRCGPSISPVRRPGHNHPVRPIGVGRQRRVVGLGDERRRALLGLRCGRRCAVGESRRRPHVAERCQRLRLEAKRNASGWKIPSTDSICRLVYGSVLPTR